MTRDRRMISGRVPTTVTTLSFFMRSGREGSGYGVGLLGIEDLVHPQHHDQLVLPNVGDVVCPTGDGLDDARLLIGDLELVHVAEDDVPEAEARAPFHDEKLFVFRVM